MDNKEFRPFDLQTLPDMFGKLEREMERLEEASEQTRADMSDHAINFATTAWHMTEWAWPGIQGLNEDHRRALEERLESTWAGFEEFRDWAKERCPELEACRQIANGSKHMTTRMYDGASLVGAEVSARGGFLPIEIPMHQIHKAEHWALKIEIAGEHRHVEAVFDRVLVFWTSVVGYGLNIDW